MEKHPVLFASSSGPDDVILNWTGTPEEKLEFYAEAFHLAGQALAIEYQRPHRLRDFAACPLVFLYRHSLELYLKAVLVAGDLLLRLRGESPLDLKRDLRTHRFLDLLADFERVVVAVGWDMRVDGLRTRDEFHSLIREFDRVDQQSFSFRYPMDKNGKPALPERFSFDPQQFAHRMDSLLEVLDATVTGVEQCYEGEAEAAVQIREYELEQRAEYESYYE